MPDSWIAKQSKENKMIEPFIGTKQKNKVISYGLSSYGYDARVSNEYVLFNKEDIMSGHYIDPKDFNTSYTTKITTDYLILPPYGFALAETIEYFRIPRDCISICLGKSTYARCGIVINVTPLEPEWEGKVTIEISNTTSMPVKIYSFEGICQFIFISAKDACQTSYKDALGKYMYQTGIEFPKVSNI